MEVEAVLVDTAWLQARLDDPSIVVADLRWREDGSGRSRYGEGHVPGAVFLDWTSDLVDPDHPVPFMLAPPGHFAEAMARAGIGDESTVVAYADQLGSGPFRLWWACRVYGHSNVRVLDGGFDKWVAEGRALSTAVPDRPPARWTARSAGEALLAEAGDVEGARDDPAAAVMDSRPAEQFRGEFVWFESGPVPAGDDGIARTPRGSVHAGHVPWAVNVPAVDLYRPDFTMKSPEELRAVLAEAGVSGPVSRAVTYCGVGISASALFFALERAGISDVRLYDGSWDEWGRSDRPVARC